MNFDLRAVPAETHPLAENLDAIEDAQLIRRLSDTDLAYIFKHGLVQDTAYESLMRHERRRLHRLVGETLEKISAERLAELAPVLGQHFSEAGDSTRAQHYLQLAGDDAAARYANREALAYYTQALDATEQAERGALYRARGQVYERIGETDEARTDLEHALQLAQQEHDTLAEWQSLIDLGYTWLASDYGRAGEYFERALDVARERNDPQLLARSLNRVGNWYLNTENPQQALTYHREALSIFEAQQDMRGVAETTDLLGMTHTLGGDLVQASENYQRTIQFAQAQGDKATLSGAYLTLGLGAPSPQTFSMVPAHEDIDVAIAGIRRALELAREIGWRAGESNVLWLLAFALGVEGNYSEGLAAAREGLSIAQSIGHAQWGVGAMCALGALHTQILALTEARQILEDALVQARATRSLHWIRTSAGFLISTCVEQGELTRAEEIFTTVLSPETPAQTVGERLCYVGRIELALARKDSAGALALIDAMLAQTPNYSPQTIISQLWLLRGTAYLLKSDFSSAEADLTAGLAHAEVQKNLWLQWQFHLQLIRLYHALNEFAQAQSHADTTRTIMGTIAKQIDDAGLRENFMASLRGRIEFAAT